MDCYHLILFASLFLSVAAWSMPFQPVQRNPIIRYVRPQRHILPPKQWQSQSEWVRLKRERDDHDYDHDYDRDHDHDNAHDHRSTSGVTGPIHTFVKTDKNANYKWGVRHHVGNQYAS
ncbi:unnamed protein product [Danaus chrysippus]|uniref:(African queen) hypothetical protein n=1 Tax=Danaus chrysippus TaxID=151541 RepID=A0A8J2VYM4_9NEOP|nr:unnamed protein product [Danaus chrysippus]